MIVLDIETTGLDPDKHSIVSAGAIEFENPDNQFYEECHMREGAEVMLEALEVIDMDRNEISDKNKQSPQSLVQNFLKWIHSCEKQTIAGHNVHFDLGFLNHVADRNELENSLSARRGHFYDRVVDTHSLVWMDLVQSGKNPTRDDHSRITSSFVFDYVGIDYERDEHNALEDAKLTAEAISRLLYDQKLFAEFS